MGEDIEIRERGNLTLSPDQIVGVPAGTWGDASAAATGFGGVSGVRVTVAGSADTTVIV